MTRLDIAFEQTFLCAQIFFIETIFKVKFIQMALKFKIITSEEE